MFPVYLTQITSSSEIVTFHSLIDESGRPNKNYLIPSSNTINPISQPDIFGNNNLYEDYTTFMGNIPSTETVDELKTVLYNKLNWRLLHAISILSNNSGDFAKTYYFQYNFYNNYKNKILEALTERTGTYQTCDATTLPPYPSNYTPQEYHFGYYNLSGLFFNPTMDREDTWGYYMSNIPYTLETTLNTVISGKPYSSPSYTKTGTLQFIQYPTGGKTIFEYELNDYSKCVKPSFVELETYNYNSSGGGLRISQITNYNNLRTISQVKKYYYTQDSVPGDVYTQKSSGILKRKPVYQSSFYTTDQIQLYMLNWLHWTSQNPGTANMQITQTGGFLMQTTNDNTPFIGYSSVIEQTLDASGNSNGYVRYQFSNYDEDVWGATHLDERYWLSNVPGDNYANSVSSRAQERGKLMAEDYYDATGILKKSVRNHYQPSNENYFLTLNQEAIFFCTDPYQCAIMLAAFKTYTYSYLMDKQIVTEYLGANNVVQTENNYSYNSHKLLSKTDIIRSDGKKQTTRLVYPFEIISGSDATVLNTMTNKHVISDYVSKITYLDEEPNGQAIEGEYRKYKEIVANSSLFRPERIDILKKGNPVSIGSLLSQNGNFVNLSTSYFQPEVDYLYDSYGNPVEYKPVGSNLPTAYLWGYNYHYPIAEIKNATYEQANTTLPANAQVTAYTYKPLVGIETITDPRGVTTYYHYDVLGRLQNIENDDNAIIERYDYHYKHNVAELINGNIAGLNELPIDEGSKTYTLTNFISIPGNNLSEICGNVNIAWSVSSNLQGYPEGDCFNDAISVSHKGSIGSGWIKAFVSFNGDTMTVKKDVQIIPPLPMVVDITQYNSNINNLYFLANTSLPATSYVWIFNSQVVGHNSRLNYYYDEQNDPNHANTLQLTASDGNKTGIVTMTVYGTIYIYDEEEE
jgi:hypothetical protein